MPPDNVWPGTHSAQSRAQKHAGMRLWTSCAGR